MNKLILVLLVTALILCGCGSGSEDTLPTTESTAPSETADTSAPDFVMYDKDGDAVRLSDFEGKPVILNFWASWCGPCKSEMPELEAAYQEYGSQIHFLMVNLTDGTNETVESASSYIAGQGYNFPVYYDTGFSGATAYGVSSIPLTLFIDANGDMVAYYLGAMSEDILLSGVALLLPEKE